MNLNLSKKANDQAAIDINLSLNSIYSVNNPVQNQPVPILGQLGLHKHIAHNIANSQFMPKNIVNLNIFMGNNCSANINILNNKSSLHFTRNNQFTSSSIIEELRNNVFHDASSSFKQEFVTQESKGSNMSEMTKSCQIPPSYLVCAPPSVNARKGRGPSTYLPNFNQKIPTAIPFLGLQLYSSSYQQQPHSSSHQQPPHSSSHQEQPQRPQHSSNLQHHAISHNHSNLSMFSLLSSYSPSKKHYHLPSFLDSGINVSNNRQIDFERENDTLHEGRLHSQSIVLAPPKSHHATGPVRNQASNPSAKHSYLPQSHFQPLFQTPDQNEIVTRPQQHLSQNINSNHTIDSNTQAKGRQRSVLRYRSHPYIKYGPYTCPLCSAVFDSRYCFAAHIQKHYKEETPMEQKRRRQSKIKNKDMSIKNTTIGITVIPKSLSLEEKFIVKSNVNGEEAMNTRGGRFCFSKGQARGSNLI